jgi:hypothetical protein
MGKNNNQEEKLGQEGPKTKSLNPEFRSGCSFFMMFVKQKPFIIIILYV